MDRRFVASLLLLSGCGAKEDTFSLSAAEQEAYEESIDKVTEDFIGNMTTAA